ncbi:hypothetical protein EMUCRT_0240 [Ehrlichia cf. muris str. EmCRT]|uniref:Uncharacterized protein n=1 Tax=Ehrlichia cf. muris str. EmCRT TaxID=1359167 RepID=A0A0F3NGQ5_9RICK|nr:hypothetical protein EMUCRT_0240 [Ehrlichia cf. muris str. EmCRT]
MISQKDRIMCIRFLEEEKLNFNITKKFIRCDNRYFSL